MYAPNIPDWWLNPQTGNLNFVLGGSASSPLVSFSSSGPVGIGTANPAALSASLGSVVDLGIYSSTIAELIIKGAGNPNWFSGIDLVSGQTTPQEWQIFQSNNSGFLPINTLAFQYFNGAAYSRPFIVESSGNVGIGTGFPAATLEVSSSAAGGTATPVLAVDTGTATGQLFTVLANGNVGIGTAAPSQELTVSNGNIFFNIPGTNANSWATITWPSSSPNFRLENASGVESVNVNSAGNTFFDGGNVGIGTASPGALVQMTDNQNAYTQVVVSNSATASPGSYGTQAGYWIWTGSNQSTSIGSLKWVPGLLTGGALYLTTEGNYPLAFGIESSPTPSMIISTATGNVGIGTATPLYTLDVNGTLRPQSGIVGTTTNNSASAGFVGEFISSVAAPSSVTVAPSGTYGNVVQISLTPGDWDVTGVGVLNAAGATYSSESWGVAVSSYSGNVVTDHVYGYNQLYFSDYSANDQAGPIPVVRFNIASTTIVYLKVTANYSAGQPLCYGRLSARRVR
jgi:hypothetical protein